MHLRSLIFDSPKESSESQTYASKVLIRCLLFLDGGALFVARYFIDKNGYDALKYQEKL